ncbi:hypothetical protein JI435_304680 [Parastagonospora nodorum SN15]|uniref:Uncharacterized protein n=1 Tax=Phaeosphaeria nodorum (strain SN15 / ATCC MYA-4574 / FGSC 10173) TaxID=321614 RepID=A0A7U2I4J7_PHANO|nr:hypothetical protein JI435_304680 [Parastagonospora nodorum SN15]
MDWYRETVGPVVHQLSIEKARPCCSRSTRGDVFLEYVRSDSM